MKKSIRRFALVLCFVFLLLPVLSISSAAVNQYDYVNVPVVVQAKSMWCWAACAEMAGRAIYPESTITQYDIVRAYKGSASDPYPNEPGYPSDMAEGIQYVANDTVIAYYMYSPMTNDEIVANVSHGYPVIASAGYYDASGTRRGGHAVVIRGTRFIDGNAGMFNYLEYIDPGDGTTRTCLYSDFSDGTYNGRIFDRTIGIFY